jgi:hypothetical protein
MRKKLVRLTFALAVLAASTAAGLGSPAAADVCPPKTHLFHCPTYSFCCPDNAFCVCVR